MHIVCIFCQFAKSLDIKPRRSYNDVNKISWIGESQPVVMPLFADKSDSPNS